MELLLQRVFDGLANGAIYGALALALVMIFRSTGLVNFAQGEMAMLSTFIALYFTQQDVPVWLCILLGAAFGFVLGAVIERTLIRPLHDKGGGELSIVIVTLGLFLGINALAGYIWEFDPRTFPSPFPSAREDFLEIGGARLRYATLGTLLTIMVVSLLLYLLLRRTKVGLAIRAVASNTESSQLVGINVGRTLMFGWGLAAAIGAVAGALIAPRVFLTPNMMFGVLVYGFAAATVGGFDSPPGAVVGGLIVGLVESLGGGYIEFIGSELKLGTALILILIVLLLKPNGLFGSAKVVRV